MYIVFCNRHRILTKRTDREKEYLLVGMCCVESGNTGQLAASTSRALHQLSYVLASACGLLHLLWVSRLRHLRSR